MFSFFRKKPPAHRRDGDRVADRSAASRPPATPAQRRAALRLAQRRRRRAVLRQEAAARADRAGARLRRRLAVARPAETAPLAAAARRACRQPLQRRGRARRPTRLAGQASQAACARTGSSIAEVFIGADDRRRDVRGPGGRRCCRPTPASRRPIYLLDDLQRRVTRAHVRDPAAVRGACSPTASPSCSRRSSGRS